MPHIWSHNVAVVTLNELVPDYYQNEKSVSNACNKCKKRGYGIRKVQSGGNGRELLIDLDSLPPTIKKHFRDPRKVDHILERYYKTDPEAVTFYQNYQFETGSYIDDQVQQRYITNASMFKALQRLRVDREAERIRQMDTVRDVMNTLLDDAITFSKFLDEKWHVKHSLPEHPTRFRQAYRKFEAEGYVSLISKKHGNSNSRKVNDSIEDLLNAMFGRAADKPSFAEISRQYDAFLDGYIEVADPVDGELYNPKDFKKLSTGTIYSYLATWKNKIGTFTLRSGDRQKLMGKFKPYHSLGHPQFAGSIISIDDRQPPFEYAKGKRMWFYNAIDLGSECFIASVWGKTKEGIIIEFYRQLVRNIAGWGFNFPAELECESSLNSSFKDTFLNPGNMFTDVRIEANNARGKRIEQYYKPLRYDIEKKSIGWLARPFALSESNQAGPKTSEYIPYDELVEARLNDIETWNNMPHSLHPEVTRWEFYQQNQHANLKPINWRGILPFLGEKTTTSCNAGIIKLQRSEFLIGEDGKVVTGDRLIQLMETIEGRDIDIYWLTGNSGEMLKALVYYGDRYICEAVAKPVYNRAKIEQTGADLQARETMSKYVATIEAYQRTRTRGVDHVVLIDNRKQTLNDGFRFPGRQSAVASGQSAVGSEQWPVEGNEVEILPEPEEEDFNTVETSFKSSLRDRF